MKDLAGFSARLATEPDEFVVRQFSPARIERLLLTRLFNLTTASDGESDGEQGEFVDAQAEPLSTASNTVIRKEAA